MDKAILVLNTGSSSIKFAIYEEALLNLIYYGEVKKDALAVFEKNNQPLIKKSFSMSSHEQALEMLIEWFESMSTAMILSAIGHRVVHSGTWFSGPILVTEEAMEKMKSLIPLAPLHQPRNLEGIHILQKRYPKLPQVACFDTTFHRTQDKLAKLFPLPREFASEGIIRYGFHGLSYEYIASVLPQYIPEQAQGRVIVAHLGHGASLCAMSDRKSVATSMGFTALDGLMMGSRCGAIDPGLILYLMEEKKYSIEKLNTLLYKQSGLLGVSGISSDMQDLESSSHPYAKEAIDLFCYTAAKEISALCANLQGCDALIFTAGIGENSAITRRKIIERLNWLGILLDEKANEQHALVISRKDSDIIACVIPTDEEYIIAKNTKDCCLSCIN